MHVPQWLAKTVFAELGIVDFSWETCVDGHCDGGTGLRLSCDDVAKLGLLYLHEGQWNGKQVLSREWVRLATSKQKDNVLDGRVWLPVLAQRPAGLPGGRSLWSAVRGHSRKTAGGRLAGGKRQRHALGSGAPLDLPG